LKRQMLLRGWIELDDRVLSPEEISRLLAEKSRAITRFGGEFFLEWNGCYARDHLGIIPGCCPEGSVWCHGSPICSICPESRSESLETAIIKSVYLRSDEGVIALSGGVDSALIAAIAKRPCIAVGVPESHDLIRAEKVSRELDLPLEIRVVKPKEIEEVLPIVAGILSNPTPVDIAIASTLYFVTEAAHDAGYERIITGQGADEIFGGYNRYLQKTPRELESVFSSDFASITRQVLRDQTVAGYHDTWLSLPYLDLRVVCAAAIIPPEERVKNGVRKRPLREVAAKYLTVENAYYEKKAMQYGTGIWKEIKRLARKNGYQNSVSDYMHKFRRV
jgi:asparagine synthase (glutamine-hydrolysing)